MSAEGVGVEEIWADDLLGRSTDAQFLKQFLVRRIEERSEDGRRKSYVLNLDAGWGYGKTFFLTRFKRQLEAEGYLAVYVNAWEDDHAGDPMIAVMAAIDEAIAPRLKKKKMLTKVWGAAKSSFGEILVTAVTHGAKKAANKILGEGADVIGDLVASGGEPSGAGAAPTSSPSTGERDGLSDHAAEALSEGVEKLFDRRGEEALKRFQEEKSSTIAFKENLSKFISDADKYKDIKSPLFILIDELDRCRPSYAISLLERVKHLFEVDNIVFIIATDSSQLRHAIKAIYGESFESGRYLLRFFDRSYNFEEPSLEALSKTLFDRFGSLKGRLSSPFQSENEEFFSSVMRYFGMSVRDAEQCFDHLRAVATIWPYPVQLELTYLLPLIVAFQQGDQELFSELEDPSQLTIHNKLLRFSGKDWDYNYDYNDGATLKVSKKSIKYSELVSLFAKLAAYPLPEATQIARNSYYGTWVSKVFDAEFARLHGNSYQPGTPPKSLLCKYPEMVRSAGRVLLTFDAG